MDAVKLFHGLAEAMYLSLGQGLIIYMLARLIIFILPWMGPVFRYKLLYISLLTIFILFTGRVIAAVMAQTGDQRSTGFALISGSAQQFNLKAVIHHYAFPIGLLYMAGILIQTILLTISLWKLRLLKGKRNLCSNPVWQDRMESLQKVLSIKKKVILRFGEQIAGPFTAGWLKPVIYFPLSALSNLSPAQVEAILIHELAHIKRNDYLWNLLQRVMEIVVYFNPVTWALSSEIRKEREFCCDDMVTQETRETVSYAKALFLLEKSRAGSSLAMAAAGRQKKTLLYRIKRITDMETTSSNGIPRVVVLAGILAFILFVAWTKSTEALSKKPKTPANNAGILSTPPSLRASTPFASAIPDTISSSSSSVRTPPASTLPEVSPVASAKVTPVAPLAPPVPPATTLTPPVPPASPAPPAARSVVIHKKDTVCMDASAVSSYFNSPEWKQQMAKIRSMGDEIKKHFESAEWKQQSEEIKKHAIELAAQFNSPEWKDKMKNIQMNAEEMQKKFNSPEWKARQQEIEQRSKELAKKFESAEWKDKMKSIEKHAAELQNKFNSPEWKKKMQDIQDKAVELQNKSLQEQDKKIKDSEEGSH